MEEKTEGNEITVFVQRSNRLPEGKVPDQAMNTSSVLRIELSEYFSDPDKDALSYEVMPNKGLKLVLKGSELSVSSGKEEGLFTVALNVSDGRGFVLSSFSMEVTAPAPVIESDERYFLSSVELIEKVYKPSLIRCLFDENDRPIYKEWSAVYYPSKSPYRFALVRVVFLNENATLSPECFMKEVRSMSDWNLAETDYGFSPRKFGRQVEEVIR
jgi:hypothetical protein